VELRKSLASAGNRTLAVLLLARRSTKKGGHAEIDTSRYMGFKLLGSVFYEYRIEIWHMTELDSIVSLC
jgi:hypothetical protein